MTAGASVRIPVPVPNDPCKPARTASCHWRSPVMTRFTATAYPDPTDAIAPTRRNFSTAIRPSRRNGGPENPPRSSADPSTKRIVGQQESEAQPSGQIPVIYAWQSLVARDEEVEKREEHEIDDPDQNRTKRIPGLLRQPRFLNGAIVLCTRHKYRGPVTRPESPDSRSSGGV